MVRRVIFMLAIAASAAAQTARSDYGEGKTSAPASSAPSDAEIRRILVERIDAQRQSVGIVVGVIEPTGRRIVTYGSLAKNDPRTLDGDTIFEIGSITKVFTSLLLADAVERHEVALTDPISKFLPASVRVPERGGRAITLQDLSTHTSGLPRLPANMAPKDASNPYADYGFEDLYTFLSGHLLDPRLPLLAQTAPPKTRTEVAVDPKIYDGYVGRYQFAPAVILTVTREGARFFAQLTGQPRFEIFASSAHEFFVKVVDAQLTFDVDAQGRASAVILHQNGVNPRAPRIE